MPLITILTPTYNREYKLGALYQSLCKQNKFNFVWLVVDDGSDDETELLVKSYQNNSQFDVKYIKKQNGGKHTAINYVLPYIDSTLTMIVDSDDILLENATVEIESIYKKYCENNNISCYSFLRVDSKGKAIVKITSDEIVANYIDYRIKRDLPGDMAEVFLTKVLKDYQFPEFKNEKFLSEDVVWIEIAKQYDSVFIKKAIYECEYIEDGLTANDKKAKFASPLGSMMRGKQLMSKECGIKVNLKGAIIYNAYRYVIMKDMKSRTYKKESRLKLNFREQILVSLSIIFGRIYYHKWKKQITIK